MPRVVRGEGTAIGERWQPQQVETGEQPAIDLAALAEEIRARAQADADALLAAARQEAETLRRAAAQEGLAEGRAEARRALTEHLAAADALVEEINRERDEFFDRAEPELVRLAVVIAEKVLAQQVVVKPDTVVEITRTHLKRIRDREILRLRLNPADLVLVSEARPELMGEIDGVREMQLHEDRRVGPGGVIIETASGIFDARFSAQLDIIRKALAEALEVPHESENP